MMSNDTGLARLKRRLLEEQERLRGLEETGREAARPVELDQTRVGRLSRMDALQGQAMSVEAGRRREIQLRNISAALQRMHDGDYGYCVECGEAIAVARLELDPAVSLCIDCATESEKRGH